MQETSKQETLSPELIARIKAIQIHTQHLVSDVLAGEYESAFKGRGMEFEEVREYQPGDDVLAQGVALRLHQGPHLLLQPRNLF